MLKITGNLMHEAKPRVLSLWFMAFPIQKQYVFLDVNLHVLLDVKKYVLLDAKSWRENGRETAREKNKKSIKEESTLARDERKKWYSLNFKITLNKGLHMVKAETSE